MAAKAEAHTESGVINVVTSSTRDGHRNVYGYGSVTAVYITVPYGYGFGCNRNRKPRMQVPYGTVRVVYGKVHEVENVKVSTMRRRAGRNGQCGSANGGGQKEEGGIHHGRLDMKKARTKAECFDLAKVLQALEGADRMTRQGKLEKGQDSKAQGTGRDLGWRRARSRTTNNQPPESQVRTAGAKIWLTSGYPLVTSWHVQLNDPAGGRVQHSPTPGGAFGGYRLATRLESTPRPVGGVHIRWLWIFGDEASDCSDLLSDMCTFPFTHLKHAHVSLLSPMPVQAVLAIRQLFGLTTLRSVGIRWLRRSYDAELFHRLWELCSPSIKHLVLDLDRLSPNSAPRRSLNPVVFLESLRIVTIHSFEQALDATPFSLAQLNKLSVGRFTKPILWHPFAQVPSQPQLRGSLQVGFQVA
ncbi:hypothetical protein GGX14DRAFT_408562 [Mycena pura]|uniref:Uncharacterized protein n=1 Tax=Mycena pura TaxID=153505 RepID=A0AAD6UKU2_9AGAR|nr:hypothetical protein GGX14DRAFT_408562 [Mycena pura]